jgi:hypothetical protein
MEIVDGCFYQDFISQKVAMPLPENEEGTFKVLTNF